MAFCPLLLSTDSECLQIAVRQFGDSYFKVKVPKPFVTARNLYRKGE